MRTNLGRSLTFLVAVALAAAAASYAPSADVTRALASVSGDSLRANLSFLASDVLEGRDTPSRGLDVAAEFIAAQFRRAGLEPAGDDGYFQTASLLRAVPAPEGFELRVSNGARTLTVPRDGAAVVSTVGLEFQNAPLLKIGETAGLKAESVRGRIVLLSPLREKAEEQARAIAAFAPIAFLQAEDYQNQPVVRRLADPDAEYPIYRGIPRIVVRDRDAADILFDAKEGETGITLSMKLREPSPVVKVRNVAGVLRGSDPMLRDQYVLLSAHYDHIGLRDGGGVFPGANDDASGTASVIEIAQALAGLHVRPKRSILFVTFFGEEEGSLGARYYVWHPLVPLAETVADLNLEQVGRTDSKNGPEISNATLTGFTYSNIARILQDAGGVTGVKVYETPGADEFYSRSDNLPFAEHGIPSHTLVVAFEFPDYHDAGDVWQKIDYANMAKVDRMVALGVVMLADRPGRPRWNEENPNVTRYVEAR